MNTWRPKDWELARELRVKDCSNLQGLKTGIYRSAYEAGANAILKAQKVNALYGEYGKDFIISAKVKKEDPDWAEPFFKTISTKGWLVFIPEEV